jgi:hypothetical protein
MVNGLFQSSFSYIHLSNMDCVHIYQRRMVNVDINLLRLKPKQNNPYTNEHTKRMTGKKIWKIGEIYTNMHFFPKYAQGA